ncbi:putative XRE-type DNA-binding protein [Sphingomonas trueperi]|uniref:Putative XRE-type DNA-binding protein n=1 Tax=Sphingomonas trueperi TaxID=53317 RepID=A0A7X5Y2K2_9SPHN|nr:putative XRE-type DNA-binding protein [Sphingomonas trueperi]
MLYLHKNGLSQTEIAKGLDIKHRQSVSKALASIPDRFWLS